MNIERLRHLREIVVAVSPEEWNMRVWWCGTAGCAGGHATRDPVFQAQGLMVGPAYCGEIGYGALAEFFDLSLGQADFIFNPEAYSSDPAPADVDAHIAEVMARTGLVELVPIPWSLDWRRWQ